MLSYLSYGAIGIAMATAILSYRLLASEQKKATPNESILKMIKLFMGLTIFFSVFFGVVELVKKKETTVNLSLASAAQYLSESDSTQLVLSSKPGSQEAAIYLNHGADQTTKLGELINNSDIDLKGVKGTDKALWNICHGSTVLGKVKLDVKEYSLIADSTGSKHFKIGEWHPIDESDFWFKINSITGKSPNYLYNITFGEGHDLAKIIPASRTLEYSKTSDGYIHLSKPFQHVRNDAWKHQYYVKFGAGLATYNSKSVQRLNVHVISIDVD